MITITDLELITFNKDLYKPMFCFPQNINRFYTKSIVNKYQDTPRILYNIGENNITSKIDLYKNIKTLNDKYNAFYSNKYYYTPILNSYFLKNNDTYINIVNTYE